MICSKLCLSSLQSSTRHESLNPSPPSSLITDPSSLIGDASSSCFCFCCEISFDNGACSSSAVGSDLDICLGVGNVDSCSFEKCPRS